MSYYNMLTGYFSKKTVDYSERLFRFLSAKFEPPNFRDPLGALLALKYTLSKVIKTKSIS